MKKLRRVVTERKNISQPPDWWREFERAAKDAGMPIAEWMGEAALEKIDPEKRKNLSERVRRGKPKSCTA